MKAEQTGKLANKLALRMIEDAHEANKLESRDLYVFMGQSASFLVCSAFHGIKTLIGFEEARTWLVLVLGDISERMSKSCGIDVKISVQVREKTGRLRRDQK